MLLAGGLGDVPQVNFYSPFLDRKGDRGMVERMEIRRLEGIETFT